MSCDLFFGLFIINCATGYYQFCIDNSLSRFASKLVSLYVAAYRRHEWESYIEELSAADVTVSNFTVICFCYSISIFLQTLTDDYLF